jgi:futalosine hydrolase
MKILIASATELEIAPLMKALNNHQYQLPGSLAVQVLITGPGMLATAARLSAFIHTHETDFIIQAGIAGCFDSNYSLGSVFRIKDDQVADMGVAETGGWRDLFDLGLVGENEFPYTNRKLMAPNNIPPGLFQIKQVSGITVNEITTNKERIKALVQKYQPVTETMEGAALHFVALENKIPFVQIRSISNYVGERNKSNWKITEAVDQLNETISSALKTFSTT